MIDPVEVTCVLLTKDEDYPSEVMEPLLNIRFSKWMIAQRCKGMYRRGELMQAVETAYIFTCDDDALAPASQLLEMAEPGEMTVVMSADHQRFYSSRKCCLLAFGAVFPKEMLGAVSRYTDVYGKDAVYEREYDRILTYFNWPQRYLDLPVTYLARGNDGTRLSEQPEHWKSLAEVIRRCDEIASSVPTT